MTETFRCILHHRYSRVQWDQKNRFWIGPGSVHVAHTDEERVAKKELMEAVEIYKNLAKRLFQ